MQLVGARAQMRSTDILCRQAGGRHRGDYYTNAGRFVSDLSFRRRQTGFDDGGTRRSADVIAFFLPEPNVNGVENRPVRAPPRTVSRSF